MPYLINLDILLSYKSKPRLLHSGGSAAALTLPDT